MKEEKNSDAYWDKIDSYLDGQLPAEEQAAVGNTRQKDAELDRDIRLQKGLRTGIAANRQQDLRQRIGKIMAEGNEAAHPSAKVVSMHTRRSWLRYAAAAALLVGALTAFWWLQSTPDASELYATNYQPYALELSQRGAATPPIQQQIQDAYQAGDYANAIPLLEAQLETEDRPPRYQLALAISYWENGQTEAAQTLLKELFDHPILQDQAYWYAGLFALREGQTATAQQLLQAIPADSGALKQQADALLKQLD